MTDLSKEEWLVQARGLADDYGYFEPLGPHHYAVFIEEGPSLLVTFENFDNLRERNPGARPIGWEMFQAQRWSSLTLISDGDTWFRDPFVYGYFDRLVDDGFFEDFDQVVFYGAGACGYAAAAYSVVSPGTRVVVVQPQATLDPSLTTWDSRHVKRRRIDFTSRYGFAPDMIEAAEHGFVIYDPAEMLDAMHAALFSRPNITRLPTRWLGHDIHTDLSEMQMLFPILTDAMEGTLTRKRFYELWRTRRNYPMYLRRLMAALDARNRSELTRLLCKNVTSRMKAPRFARRLRQIESVKG